MSSLYRDKRYITSQTYTETYATRYSAGEGTLYTIPSDGIPRYCFKAPPTAVSVSIFEMERVRTMSAIPLTLPPQPPCTMEDSWCNALLNFRQKSYRQNGALDFGPPKKNKYVYDMVLGLPPQQCGVYSQWTGECSAEVDEEVVLIYWPEDDISSETCDENKGRHTITRHARGSKSPPPPVVTDKIIFKGQDLYKTGQGTDIYGA
jgi:hypothetical protein